MWSRTTQQEQYHVMLPAVGKLKRKECTDKSTLPSSEDVGNVNQANPHAARRKRTKESTSSIEENRPISCSSSCSSGRTTPSMLHNNNYNQSSTLGTLYSPSRALNTPTVIRVTLQSFILRGHHDTPTYSAYWDEDKSEIAMETAGHILMDFSPSDIWREPLVVHHLKKEGSDGWVIEAQRDHLFSSPFVIKLNKAPNGKRKSLAHKFRVFKKDTDQLLAETPLIRAKAPRTMNDRYVKLNKRPIKDCVLNFFQLNFRSNNNNEENREQGTTTWMEVCALETQPALPRGFFHIGSGSSNVSTRPNKNRSTNKRQRLKQQPDRGSASSSSSSAASSPLPPSPSLQPTSQPTTPPTTSQREPSSSREPHFVFMPTASLAASSPPSSFSSPSLPHLVDGSGLWSTGHSSSPSYSSSPYHSSSSQPSSPYCALPDQQQQHQLRPMHSGPPLLWLEGSRNTSTHGLMTTTATTLLPSSSPSYFTSSSLPSVCFNSPTQSNTSCASTYPPPSLSPLSSPPSFTSSSLSSPLFHPSNMHKSRSNSSSDPILGLEELISPAPLLPPPTAFEPQWTDSAATTSLFKGTLAAAAALSSWFAAPAKGHLSQQQQQPQSHAAETTAASLFPISSSSASSSPYLSADPFTNQTSSSNAPTKEN
ncbi:hypothetical protein QOT17_018870 [Balamuthia mandrillaris]